MVDHRRTMGRGVGPGTEAERSIAELRLGRWEEINHRVLARLVPHRRAGPLSFEPPLAPWPGPASVRFDVGIDVDGGIVRLDAGLIRSLGVPLDEIWRAAVTNLDGHDQPPALAVPGRGTEPFTVLAGGPWTTGLLLVPGRLDPGAVVVAPHPEVLVVGRQGVDAAPGGWDGPDRRSLVRATVALAATLADADGGPRLPPVPLRPVDSIQEVLSRAHGFWNDVPVSEQPGLR